MPFKGTPAAPEAVAAVDRIYERARGRGNDAEFSELGFRTEEARTLAAATARDLNESLLATEWAAQEIRRR